jgi:hypothetical protein
MLTDIGMEAFAERASRELLAIGETVRKRTVETLDELTPQELQVARLAIGGQANPEIGAQLFISARTRPGAPDAVTAFPPDACPRTLARAMDDEMREVLRVEWRVASHRRGALGSAKIDAIRRRSERSPARHGTTKLRWVSLATPIRSS